MALSLLPSSSWFVTFRDPREIWDLHPTLLINEVTVYLVAAASAVHAIRKGGRWPYMWVGIILHGLMVESISYLLPDIDNFWHAQSSTMLLGQRLPMHVIVLYPMMIYHAYVAVNHMGLPWWAEPFAVALGNLLIDIPFDIMGIKMLWWTWHDTDPNIFDRHYWVPWTSYIFHMTFSFSFTMLTNASRWLLTGSSSRDKVGGSFIAEVLTVLIPGFLSFPVAVATQFTLIYHVLHDSLEIHTENLVFTLIAIYVFMVWIGERHADRGTGSRAERGNGGTWLLGWLSHETAWAMLLHFIVYTLMAYFATPQTQLSIGLHEPLGPCDAPDVVVMSPLGQALSKRAYLCTSDYDEDYLSMDCNWLLKSHNLTRQSVTALPDSNGITHWYAVCGKPYPNSYEYIHAVGVLCAVGLAFFHTALTPRPQPGRLAKRKSN